MRKQSKSQIISIMQPYFLPYLEYWRLIYYSDVFVIYDNIEFTKKSWIRKNKIYLGGFTKEFTLPIKKGSDFATIREREISEDFSSFSRKLMTWIKIEYIDAPYYIEVFNLMLKIINYESKNLFDFIKNSISVILDYLEINTKIVVSSTLDEGLLHRGQSRVIDLVKKSGGKIYINPISGKNLYDYNLFLSNEIELRFLDKIEFYYYHKDHLISDFSIIDLLMYVNKSSIKEFFDENNVYES